MSRPSFLFFVRPIVRACGLSFILAGTLSFADPIPAEKGDPGLLRKDRSHSHIADAFNTGPRQLARLIPNVGNGHIPITAKNPKAQAFFDQGLNMFYTYWWYEAERAFRQTLAVEPDCPMGYWGLAMMACFLGQTQQGREFIDLARKGIDRVTPQEREYIEIIGWLLYVDRSRPENVITHEWIARWKTFCERYPEDLEAKLFYGNAITGALTEKSKDQADAIYREIIAKSPKHTGAHHFRIHMWDGLSAQKALDSCLPLIEAAPNVGHAQHMAGHIYASLGMWNEAARTMDIAARIERRYMLEQKRMPYHTWNYEHNQDYLALNLAYAGRIRQAIRQGEELASVPQYENIRNSWGPPTVRLRGLVRGERWDEILAVHPKTSSIEVVSYARALALLSRNDIPGAKHEYDAQKYRGKMMREIRGLLEIEEGKTEEGLATLRKWMEEDLDERKYVLADPEGTPRPSYHAYVTSLIRFKRWNEAEEALRLALDFHKNDPYALALLAEVNLGQGDAAKAIENYQAALKPWAHADVDLPALLRLQKCMAPHLKGQIFMPTPFDPTELDRFGPAEWKPYSAENFEVTLPSGAKKSLKDYRGQNLLLVFYLGDQCKHCLEQLEALGKDVQTYRELGVQILAVSSDSPQQNKAFLKDNPDYPLPIASDPSLKAAKAMAAYDEFENLELHATILIDKKGRVWWYDAGSNPYMNFEFLKREIKRMNQMQQKI